jgi:hypothetical protein
MTLEVCFFDEREWAREVNARLVEDGSFKLEDLALILVEGLAELRRMRRLG